VITRPGGGALLESVWRNWRSRIYVPAAVRAGLQRPRPYDLRHSFVSLLIWEGRNVAEVATQAGHSVETCSRDYIHVFKESRGTRGMSATTRIWRARKAAGLPVFART
jgi:integrase